MPIKLALSGFAILGAAVGAYFDTNIWRGLTLGGTALPVAVVALYVAWVKLSGAGV